MTDRTIDHGGDDTGMLPDDIDELRQRDDDYPAVRVRVEGPVTVHDLPARYAYSRNVTVTNSADPSTLEQIAAGDLRIKEIAILCTTNPVYVGFDKQNVADGICGILPVDVVLKLSTAAPIWVRATAATAVVSWWATQWAD